MSPWRRGAVSDDETVTEMGDRRRCGHDCLVRCILGGQYLDLWVRRQAGANRRRDCAGRCRLGRQAFAGA